MIKCVICDRIWENPAYYCPSVHIWCNMWPDLRNPACQLYEIWVSCTFEWLYHRANLPPSLRPIACFTLELEHLVHDRATPTEKEILRSKGIAMHAYSISVYYVWTGNQFNGLGWTQRSSYARTSSLIMRAASMPKKLKRWVNVQYFNESSCV